MALESWLASLKRDVTAVTDVTTTIHAGCRGNGTEKPDVTDVTKSTSPPKKVTSVTAEKNQALPLQPAQALEVTAVTSVTCKKTNTQVNAANELLSDDLLTGLDVTLSTGTSSNWWRLHFHDLDPVELIVSPPATHADILERYPDAVGAKPFTPTFRQPSSPLTAEDEKAIRAWLAHINETEPEEIAQVIDQCQCDVSAREYFIAQAAKALPKPEPFLDDRRTCNQCTNLQVGRCLAAKSGQIRVSRDYKPVPDPLRRCIGYAPRQDDHDQRSGRERWPRLTLQRTEE